MKTHEIQNILSKIADWLICKLTDKEPEFRLRAVRGRKLVKVTEERAKRALVESSADFTPVESTVVTDEDLEQTAKFINGLK